METAATNDVFPDTIDVFDIAQATIVRDDIANIVGTLLNNREYRIICLRFGLGEETVPHSREEIGEILGLTRERIRQIEIEALEKLRPHLETYASEGLLDVEPNGYRTAVPDFVKHGVSHKQSGTSSPQQSRTAVEGYGIAIDRHCPPLLAMHMVPAERWPI